MHVYSLGGLDEMSQLVMQTATGSKVMNTPVTTKTCPECGGALAVDSPEGLCRACLLKRGLETNTVAGSEAGEIENRELKIEKGWVPPAVGELARLFPELEILELIGRGGMGAV